MTKRQSSSTKEQRQGFFWLALLLALGALAAALPGGIRRERCPASPQPAAPLSLAATADTVPRHKPFRKAPFSLEMNSADTLDWQQLYGIGPVLSKRIVAYRSRLGGFYAKEQLLEVYGITDTLYAGLLPSLRLDTASLRRIYINLTPLDSLKRHPYIDYYQAKALTAYRQHHGSYTSACDLMRVSLLDSATVSRLKPYLSFKQ